MQLTTAAIERDVAELPAVCFRPRRPALPPYGSRIPASVAALLLQRGRGAERPHRICDSRTLSVSNAAADEIGRPSSSHPGTAVVTAPCDRHPAPRAALRTAVSAGAYARAVGTNSRHARPTVFECCIVYNVPYMYSVHVHTVSDIAVHVQMSIMHVASISAQVATWKKKKT